MVHSIDIPSSVALASQSANEILANSIAAPCVAGDPLTLNEVGDAHVETLAKERLFQQNAVNASELGACIVREHAVAHEHVALAYPAAVAPPWFIPALHLALQPIREQLFQMEIESARTWNSAAGDGLAKPWKVVKFTNGDMPTQPPHNLPRIANRNELDALTGAQLASYLIGYAAPVGPAQLSSRRRRLCALLGVYLC
jgi:hypothetical protein